MMIGVNRRHFHSLYFFFTRALSLSLALCLFRCLCVGARLKVQLLVNAD